MKILNCFLCACAALFASVALRAQGPAVPEAPGLEFVVELHVTCDPGFTVGHTQHGNRFVIPITGGTFEGPKMKGVVLAGGADYQLQDQAHGRTELEAIYCIRTDDGVNIHVRNWGLSVMGRDESGRPQFYFRTAPKFEAPRDSPYGWLNDAIFVCAPGPNAPGDTVCLRIWKVL
jgi:hypothetical protein